MEFESIIVDEFDTPVDLVMINLRYVHHEVMPRLVFFARWEHGGYVNGLEYSIDAISERPLEDIAKTTLGQLMIARCREDVLSGQWEQYEAEIAGTGEIVSVNANENANENAPGSMQQKALAFFKVWEDTYANYSVIFEGDFACEWRCTDGTLGWLDAKGQEGKYRISGDVETRVALLQALGIAEDKVIVCGKQ